ncbi:hypothetical protein WJX84_006754 [Apatococcus fuscideae]|uniref:Phospho-2-dehydro-3-deoxyheptonate aldolase n=1 Tax=Apatococcus fuscideae TaxID=2026836 RepID=A0AAW1TDK8_9CHLO
MPGAVLEPPAVPFRGDAEHLAEWSRESWSQREALQQPDYPNSEALQQATAWLARQPPLVFAGECRTLQAHLAQCATGEAFLLQGGDCAESFKDFTADRIRDTFRVMLQMSVVMTFGGSIPVVKMGRMAGQFAKPRSSPMEKCGDRQLPSYRGDIINGPEQTEEARIPNPDRLKEAYNQSCATLNLLRAFAKGGYADLRRVTQWNLDFMGKADEGRAYLELSRQIDAAIKFMVACGLSYSHPIMTETEFHVGHECLLLDYEQALTRQDSTTGLWYGCSGHFLWCGERTRQLDGAHLEYLRGIANPLGVKVSDKMDPNELISLIEAVNPENVPGRISVIVRMGAGKLRAGLPGLIKAVQRSGHVVTWVCDPMHGNIEAVNGIKTRRYKNVRAEVEAFFDVHEELGTIPGGIHLEMTGDDVTECVGGGSSITETDLTSRYHTHCDPRLNAEQALELAFYVASRLAQRKDSMASFENQAASQPHLAMNGKH